MRACTIGLMFAALTMAALACGDGGGTGGSGGTGGLAGSGGSGGAGGTGGSGGAGGAGGAGGTGGVGGTGGSGGGSACPLHSTSCSSCESGSCGTPLVACNGDATCKAALEAYDPCVCTALSTGDQAAFGACNATLFQSGTKGSNLDDCLATNCHQACFGM